MNFLRRTIAMAALVLILLPAGAARADQKTPAAPGGGAGSKTATSAADKQASVDAQKRLEKMVKISKMPIKLTVTPIEVKGEVIDVWCYVSQTMGPGRGPDHLPCATKCVLGGMPIGIVDGKTGDVYVAAKSDKAYTGCFDQLKGYIGKTVTVKGFTANRGGCRVLRVQTVTESK
jgi:hypothetical protein